MRVYIRRQTEDRAAFVRALLQQPEIDELLAQARRVLVKPNLVSAEPAPETTHPAVLREVLQLLQQRELRVTVADGPPPFVFNLGKTPRIVAGRSPLAPVCAEAGLELINLHERGFRRVTTPSGLRLHVSTLALEHDLLLSLPVAKVHNICDITGAMKNQFGLLPNPARLACHAPIPGTRDLHRVIAEVNRVCPPAIYVVDAVSSYRGAQMKILGGVPCHPRTMLGGLDPLALDVEVLALLRPFEPKLEGKGWRDIEHLAWAERVELGRWEAEHVVL